jgi:predicted nucleic acid-binding protein
MTVLTVGKAFFDTNVFLYMQSAADPLKQVRARELVEHYGSADRIAVSTQVVQEFYAVGSRKLALPREQVQQTVETLLTYPLVVIGPSHILRAIENEQRYQLSFWDSLILTAAESVGAEVLFTEDLNDGQQYGEVLVRNPFRTEENSKAR